MSDSQLYIMSRPNCWSMIWEEFLLFDFKGFCPLSFLEFQSLYPLRLLEFEGHYSLGLHGFKGHYSLRLHGIKGHYSLGVSWIWRPLPFEVEWIQQILPLEVACIRKVLSLEVAWYFALEAVVLRGIYSENNFYFFLGGWLGNYLALLSGPGSCQSPDLSSN